MQLSTKSRYGLRILLDIAATDLKTPRSIKEIARSQEISEKYVSCLAVKLKRAGFIRALRGVNGGLVLSKRPEDISVLDIVECMEGRVGLVECVYDPAVCSRSENCAACSLWSKLSENMRREMKKVTLRALTG